MPDDMWDEKTWKTARFACLNCGYFMDAASISPLDNEPRGPGADDVSICLKCSHIMIFTRNGLGGLTVREPNAAEMKEITNDHDILRLLQAMAELRRMPRWKRKHDQGKKGRHGSRDGGA